eukprot:CAMPEP_0114352584 /NCGR_PEP_ID=MMETSP0101-20121206/18049_1 /TAXON_ID=38822 ORGANISM="Pteridomonas danica, Strain PT" /NCGR_SAMPLE_ID=MMETSP0101 /ASSEMBLY_ACC=CAM_ASM_000211 /LENGTH=223 /DNA_ID=CAMNT_0001493045 /DNA_START=848 /DNA_END=1519 /DNA_ORIENTATION=+
MAQAAMRAKAQPEKRLGNRTVDALSKLMNAKKLPQVISACSTLEISTRLSPPCCAAFASGGAASIVFKHMKTCNRSTPHQEVLKSTLIVLNNVASRGPSIIQDMLHVQPSSNIEGGVEDAIEVLTEMITVFKDNESIFEQTVKLFERFLLVDGEFQRCLNEHSEIKKRLVATVSFLEKKYSVSASESSQTKKASVVKSSLGKKSISQSKLLQSALKLKALVFV